MWIFLIVVLVLLARGSFGNRAADTKTIAVIGGGISGTFFTKYMVEYDPECKLDSITLFDPHPSNDTVKSTSTTSTDDDDDNFQGSRVSSLQLEDGSVVELGASVLYKGFHLVLDMIRTGGLELDAPFVTGREEFHNATLRTGMGIYTGNGTWALRSPTSSGVLSPYLKKLQLVWRYNRDLLLVSKICKQALSKFAMVPAMLASPSPEYFFDAPSDIWNALGLTNAVYHSFDTLLDAIGVSSRLAGWRKHLLPYQGNLRSELLTAINLVNYNQDNANVNGMVGLGSFAASAGDLYSVKGGNFQIIHSAFQQAVQNRNAHCNKNNREGTVRQVTKRVTSIVGDLEGLELFSGSEHLGEFDIVILAAPLQQARIECLVQSHMDRAVLVPMPLGGRVDAHNSEVPDDGHSLLPADVPNCAVRPYKQVVTTVVRDAVLSLDIFKVANESDLPRSIAMNAQGKALTYNITAITQISGDGGVYKVFSDNRLSTESMIELFGSSCMTEYVKMWGGPHGGATPDYKSSGGTTRFLLYDGAIGFHGHTSSGALYYPVAMEQSTLASMEMAAVGAKAVAKLVAERLGLLERRVFEDVHDEL